MTKMAQGHPKKIISTEEEFFEGGKKKKKKEEHKSPLLTVVEGRGKNRMSYYR